MLMPEGKSQTLTLIIGESSHMHQYATTRMWWLTLPLGTNRILPTYETYNIYQSQKKGYK